MMGRPKIVRDRKCCSRCRRVFPLAAFRGRDGRGVEGGYCPECRKKNGRDYEDALRAARGKTKRPPRINPKGDVYCHHCKVYLRPTRFKVVAFPSQGNRPRFWSYCVPCTRAKDRERWTGERQETNNASRGKRQKRQQEAARKEKIATVQNAIRTLRLRGLTKAEIVRLTRTTWSSLLKWERGERVPTPAVVSRFVVVLRATADLEPGETPATRRRLPHPDIEELMWRCREVERFPVRDAWKHRRAS